MRTVFLLGVLPGLAIALPSAQAQEPVKTEEKAPDAKEKTPDPESNERVSVTATKRSTLVQDTPLAVTAVTQRDLDRAQVKDLSSLQTMVPNLSVEQHGDSGGVHVFLRGVGSTNHTELGDPAVAFHVDGIYSPRPQGATALMYDLSHVEVARGPQGTLFGRNATAGSINLVTQKPRLFDSSGSTSMVFGNYNRLGIQGAFNVPLGETAAIRVAAITDQHDGYVDFQPRSSVLPGTPKYMAGDQTGTRATLLWEPVDAVTTTLAVETYRDTGTGTIALMQKPRAGQDRYSALVDTPGVLDQSTITYRGRVDYRPIDAIELSYIGSWSRLKRKNASDYDAGTLPGFKQEHRTESSQFDSDSHEIQVKSMDSGAFQWLAGLFSIREDNAIRFDIDVTRVQVADDNAPIPPYPTQPTDTAWAMSFIQPKRTLESQAAFGQGTLSLTDNFRVTLGARATTEKKQDVGGRNWVCPDFGATLGNGGHVIGPGGSVNEATCGSAYAPGTWPGGGANDAETKDSADTYLARAEFNPAADLMTYLTLSTGFKSGGLSDGGRRHKPEFLTNYEWGVKSEFLNRRLALNLALFLMKYKDMQVSSIEYQPNGQQQLVTSNAAASTIAGFESEVSWRISRTDRWTGQASILEAKYDDFLTCDSALLDCSLPENAVNLDGNYLPHAPRLSLTTAYEHDVPLEGGATVMPRVQLHYQTESYLNAFNDAPADAEKPGSFSDARTQKAYTTVDASLRYQVAKNVWFAEAFVLNASNEAVKTDASWIADSSTWTSFYNPPRTYGVKLGHEF
ncbi:MAG TPA: TonB-dependent receptor [Oligoflexus sp.]|uniref:TonB-dependent receptor n=1 Tax=Oligoflexus sp. TaxID=1971216 RepID=UPI002D4DAFF8|nr:TonB-dependent receptor [Oligoflexus sp.]HYX38438.1 TonB-dependent receptor [Oligoflexus sp.]